MENEDCNAMADNLTQCGLGKEARPVRLKFDTSNLEKVVVIFFKKAIYIDLKIDGIVLK